MHCKKTLSYANSYLDSELADELKREVERHLAGCQACRDRFEGVRQVGSILDSLSVPPVPQGLTGRIMAEAQRRRLPLLKERRPLSTLAWQPIGWFAALPASMRSAVGAVVILASLLGLFLSKEIVLSAKPHAAIAREGDLEGLEWFNPTPPGSVGSAYLTVGLMAFNGGDVP